MGLPQAERAQLARDIIRSLDEAPEVDAQAAWTAEISRRLEDAKAHPEKLLTLDEVKQRMVERRAARRAAR